MDLDEVRDEGAKASTVIAEATIAARETRNRCIFILILMRQVNVQRCRVVIVRVEIPLVWMKPQRKFKFRVFLEWESRFRFLKMSFRYLTS